MKALKTKNKNKFKGKIKIQPSLNYYFKFYIFFFRKKGTKNMQLYIILEMMATDCFLENFKK